jgi:hypothetical protein
MHDNLLTSVDMRRLESGGEDHTPEGALLHGAEPLLDCGRGVDKVVFMRRILKLAREYVVDYDLVRASARAGIPWDLCRYLERDASFITAVDMISRELTPEEIITRAEVLNMLKREASTASKARDRVSAIKVLATVAGFTKDDEANERGHVPVINITLQGGVAPPTVNVTPAPAKLRVGAEGML